MCFKPEPPMLGGKQKRATDKPHFANAGIPLTFDAIHLSYFLCFFRFLCFIS